MIKELRDTEVAFASGGRVRPTGFWQAARELLWPSRVRLIARDGEADGPFLVLPLRSGLLELRVCREMAFALAVCVVGGMMRARAPEDREAFGRRFVEVCLESAEEEGVGP